MASRLPGSVVRDLERLFQDGTAVGSTDAQLLDRFRAQRDESAFVALVRRHGPLVLGVCRRVLGNANDADDAFQATFLIFARKAGTGSVRAGDSLAPWLHGVARRVALRARATIGLRREVGLPGRVPVAADASDEAARRELRSLIREEIALLPATYRSVVELCDLAGMTHDQAARRLGWPLGTVSVRLMRARRRLRVRLIRRGVVPSATILASAMGGGSAWAEVPAALVETTAQATMGMLAGKAVGVGGVSSSVTLLMEGALRAMFLKKAGMGLAGVVVMAGTLTAGAGFLAQEGSGSAKGQQPAQNHQAQAVSPQAKTIQEKLDARVESLRFRGQLEKFLKHIREISTGPNDRGIPIYLDPSGLRELQFQTMPWVNVDMKDVPLRTLLGAALQPLGLSYTIKDGLLIIDSRTGLLERRMEDVEQKLDRVLKALDELRHEGGKK